jgi:hypothetical protein
LQAFYFDFRVGEITCPAVYTKESSSINFPRSVVYGLGVLSTALEYAMAKRSLSSCRIFHASGRKLNLDF